MRKSLFQKGFAAFGIVMVVATITLVGVVAFRFLAAQDNTHIAKIPTPESSTVASVETVEDVETVTAELDQATAELDNLDAELDAEFAF